MGITKYITLLDFGESKMPLTVLTDLFVELKCQTVIYVQSWGFVTNDCTNLAIWKPANTHKYQFVVLIVTFLNESPHSNS